MDDKIVLWEQNSGKGFDLTDTTISTIVFACGDQLFDDRDSNSYNTVLIGDQCLRTFYKSFILTVSAVLPALFSLSSHVDGHFELAIHSVQNKLLI